MPIANEQSGNETRIEMLETRCGEWHSSDWHRIHSLYHAHSCGMHVHTSGIVAPFEFWNPDLGVSYTCSRVPSYFVLTARQAYA
jgi:hypothetical protein